jgi:hypothetical protein
MTDFFTLLWIVGFCLLMGGLLYLCDRLMEG